MFSATLEPLIIECQKAIELAQAGNHAAAREKLDRIRYLRGLVSRSQISEAGRSKLSFFSESTEVITAHKQMAENANTLLGILHQWISSSRAAFTIDELRSSEEGINLFIDDALPSVWDFNHDLVILTDRDGQAFRDALRKRGHKKFVWLREDVGLGDRPKEQPVNVLETAPAELDSDEIGQDTLYLYSGQQPDIEVLKRLIGASLPRMALIAHSPTGLERSRFDEISHAVSSAVIHSATAQWLCEQTTEQYLSHISRLAECRSVMSLKSLFEDADVLILSPGPSLRADLDLLRTYADRFLTIAPVKSLEALFAADIIPDFAIWMDPRDHSYAIPVLDDLNRVPLILGETCHDAFFSAPFQQHFIYPDPNFLTSSITQVLHGTEPAFFPGTSVSTLATVMSTTLGAKSVTLIGQDLSVGGGQYVSPGAVSAEDLSESPGSAALTCKAIGGGELPTQPNYLGFISEFQLMGKILKSQHQLTNCTASGAYLEGWDHIPFSEHPLLQSDNAKGPERSACESPSQSSLSVDNLLGALDELDEQIYLAIQISQALIEACLTAVEDGSNDVTKIEELEERLRPLLHEDCTMLAYYVSPRSMAIKAAAESNQSLDDNLRLSADYYDAIARAATRLASFVEQAKVSLEA